MKESLQSFVVHPSNAVAYKVVTSLARQGSASLRLLIEGPRGSGKSSLVRGFASDAEQSGQTGHVFICSGSDIAMALQFEADDSFFDRVGSVPVLLIDDLEPLVNSERGDFFLSLLLAERSRQDISTVITSDTPFGKYCLADSKALLDTFVTIQMQPLDSEGQADFVRLAQQSCRTAQSPALCEEAIGYLAEQFCTDYFGMEAAVQYLMTDEGCRNCQVISLQKVQELLRT